MKQTKNLIKFSTIQGYILIPHELLHVIGFWLVGKKCHYQWGDCSVKPLDSMTRKERLWGMLIPFILFVLLFIICTILSGLAYSTIYGHSLGWFVVWTILALIMGIYTGTTITDLRRAYLLIFNKPWYGWTPFDIFFWPIVDWEQIRNEELRKETNEKQN